jgi:hypothetical protein
VDQINPYPGQTEHCLFFILGVSLPLSLLIKPTAKTKEGPAGLASGHIRICALSHGTNLRSPACPIRGGAICLVPGCHPIAQHTTLCFAARNGTDWMGP